MPLSSDVERGAQQPLPCAPQGAQTPASQQPATSIPVLARPCRALAPFQFPSPCKSAGRQAIQDLSRSTLLSHSGARNKRQRRKADRTSKPSLFPAHICIHEGCRSIFLDYGLTRGFGSRPSASAISLRPRMVCLSISISERGFAPPLTLVRSCVKICSSAT